MAASFLLSSKDPESAPLIVSFLYSTLQDGHLWYLCDGTNTADTSNPASESKTVDTNAIVLNQRRREIFFLFQSHPYY